MFHLGQLSPNGDPFTPPEDLQPLIPAGNFTNQTIFDETLEAQNQKPLVVIRVDHGIDAGYSGKYESKEVSADALWKMSYEVRAYGKAVETINIEVAKIYRMKIQVSFDLFDMQVLKQTFTFVHPLAILSA